MKSKIFFWIVLVVMPISLFAATESFPRNLSLGMRGSDVLALQQFLNTDTDTRVAEMGAGSRGNETDYFGPATKRAVAKFQDKYRAEVLTPVGLVSGNGFFGSKTRAQVVVLRDKISSPPTPTSGTVSSIDTQGEVIVMFPSQYSGIAGTTITISGAGFTPTNNTIYFGEHYAVEKASSWNGQSITFNIPSIPKGNYSLYVKNTRGESNKDSFFVVTDGITPEPKIENISPSQVVKGSLVSVTGSGFTTTGNMIRTGIAIVENISSNGTLLSFVVPETTTATSTVPASSKKASFPIWVYVVNENGVSNGKSFDLGF